MSAVPDDPPRRAGRAIEEALERKGWTRYRLAKEAQVNESQLGKVVRGDLTASPGLIRKVAPFLDVSEAELMTLAAADRAGDQELVRSDLDLLKRAVAFLAGMQAAIERAIDSRENSYGKTESAVMFKDFYADRDEIRGELAGIRLRLGNELGKPVPSEGFVSWVQALTFEDVAAIPEGLSRLASGLPSPQDPPSA